MIGNDNVLGVSIDFFICKTDEFISHSHPVENSITPDSDKNIGVFIRFFVEGEQIDRQAQNDCKQKSQNNKPKPPEII